MKTEIVEFLKQVDSLSHLEENELERLADVLKVRHVAPNEMIIREGDVAQDMHFIYSGSVHVSELVPKESPEQEDFVGAPLHYFSKGDLIGEMAFFDQRNRSATVFAAMQTTLLTLTYRDMEKLIQYDGILASRLFFGIIRDLTLRLRDTNHGVALLYKRLIRYDRSLQDILVRFSAEDEIGKLLRSVVY